MDLSYFPYSLLIGYDCLLKFAHATWRLLISRLGTLTGNKWSFSVSLCRTWESSCCSAVVRCQSALFSYLINISAGHYVTWLPYSNQSSQSVGKAPLNRACFLYQCLVPELRNHLLLASSSTPASTFAWSVWLSSNTCDSLIKLHVNVVKQVLWSWLSFMSC